MLNFFLKFGDISATCQTFAPGILLEKQYSEQKTGADNKLNTLKIASFKTIYGRKNTSGAKKSLCAVWFFKH